MKLREQTQYQCLTGYFGQNAHHINVNVFNRELLLDAMEHPELYPQLTIRVSGYAVNFTKLTREQQLDVINRTIHEKIQDKMKEIIGNIHSVESFGAVDGPGIRTVIFMQGCKLKCKYCHNRDTWKEAIGKNYTVEEMVEYVLRYKSYFDSSGGGVTISRRRTSPSTSFCI